jgi:hypothetical protein
MPALSFWAKDSAGRVYFKDGRGFSEAIPQGFRPLAFPILFGTSKAASWRKVDF